jgi:hypothetical protein
MVWAAWRSRVRRGHGIDISVGVEAGGMSVGVALRAEVLRVLALRVLALRVLALRVLALRVLASC